LVVEDGEGDGLYPRVVRFQAPDELDAVHARKLDVHDDDIHRKPRHLLQGFLRAAGDVDDLNAALLLQDADEPLQHDLVDVHEHYVDGLCILAVNPPPTPVMVGILTVMRVPMPGSELTESSPPS